MNLVCRYLRRILWEAKSRVSKPTMIFCKTKPQYDVTQLSVYKIKSYRNVVLLWYFLARSGGQSLVLKLRPAQCTSIVSGCHSPYSRPPCWTRLLTRYPPIVAFAAIR